MKFILGKKMVMTQVFRADGTVVPVTRVAAGPCVITQIKNVAKDHVRSVQIGYGEQKLYRLTKPEQGHLKGLATVRFLRDFRIDTTPRGKGSSMGSENDANLKRGDVITVKVFAPGDIVTVIGTSKGKGFQGVVKRYNFRGGPASHGHKDNLRMPGTIGAGGVQRVMKGKRMGGHMGDQRVTVKNLEIMGVDLEKKELLIKGALPGARGGLLLISTNGDMELETAPVVEAAPEASAPVAEEVVEKTPVVEGVVVTE